MRKLIALVFLASPMAVAQLSAPQQAYIDAQIIKWKAEAEAAAVLAKKACGSRGVVDLPRVGMSEQRMLECTQLGRAGAFTLIDTLEVPGSVTRQYKALVELKFVYTRNGVVTAIQK